MAREVIVLRDGPCALAADSLILLHFLAAGLQSTATRAAARERLDAETLAFATSLTTLVIAGGALLLFLGEFRDVLHSPTLTPRALVFAGLGFAVIGTGYFLTSYARFQGHKLLPSYVFEPLSRTHVLIVVPVSMIFIEPESSALEWVAIAAALVPVFVLAAQTPRSARAIDWALTQGVAWVLVASVCAAGLQLASKLAVDPEIWIGLPVLVFMVGSNAASAVVSALRHIGREHRGALSSTFRYGALAGVCNVIALGSLLLFLVDGKPSRIYSVGAMSMLIPVLWGLLTRRERAPTPWELLAFTFAVAAIALQYQVAEP